VIDEYEFENMKRKEERAELSLLVQRDERESDANASFVRKGVVGGYADHLSAEDIEYADRAVEKLHPEIKAALGWVSV
jgi:hypothetical protein